MATKYPDADILIHPESNCSGDPAIMAMPQTYYYSTAGMLRHISESEKSQFVIMTEKEIIHQMEKEQPGKEFISAGSRALCGQMKRNTLEKVLLALQNEGPEIKVEGDLRERAWKSIEKMLEL
jgi:quinolinate synthase